MSASQRGVLLFGYHAKYALRGAAMRVTQHHELHGR